MKVTLSLEAPVLTSAVKVGSDIQLDWDPNEDTRAFTEWDVFCKDSLDTEYTLCAITSLPGSPTATVSKPDSSDEESDFVSGHTYQFYVVNYQSVFPLVAGDSAPSNVLEVVY